MSCQQLACNFSFGMVSWHACKSPAFDHGRSATPDPGISACSKATRHKLRALLADCSTMFHLFPIFRVILLFPAPGGVFGHLCPARCEPPWRCGQPPRRGLEAPKKFANSRSRELAVNARHLIAGRGRCCERFPRRGVTTRTPVWRGLSCVAESLARHVRNTYAGVDLHCLSCGQSCGKSGAFSAAPSLCSPRTKAEKCNGKVPMAGHTLLLSLATSTAQLPPWYVLSEKRREEPAVLALRLRLTAYLLLLAWRAWKQLAISTRLRYSRRVEWPFNATQLCHAIATGGEQCITKRAR